MSAIRPKHTLVTNPPIDIRLDETWKPNIFWKLFNLLIYGGIKIPMAEQDTSSNARPPIVQWPVFIFIFGLVLVAFSYLRDNNKDSTTNAATQATILEKLNSIDSAIKSNKELTQKEIDDIKKNIDELKDGQKDIETFIALSPNFTKQGQQQQMDEHNLEKEK